MSTLLKWLTDNGVIAVFMLCLLSFIVGISVMIARPSPWQKNYYNECLEIILRSGTIADAETMCADLKSKP